MLLSSRRLQVTVTEPGVFPNTTCRFDRSGFIPSVLLDGRYEFCTKEPENLRHPSSGGCGLCHEFIAPGMCGTDGGAPLFPKPGIGLFRRKGTAPYCFYDKYETVPFSVTVSHTPSTAYFQIGGISCCGYQFTETRRLEVNGCRLLNTVTLKNTGSRHISATEYCHNFLTIEHRPLGNGYHLRMPDLNPEFWKTKTAQSGPEGGEAILPGTLIKESGGFTFSGCQPESALYSVPGAALGSHSCFTWELMHDQSDAGVKVTEQFMPSSVTIWFIDHLISVEVFYPVNLLPGEESTWTRCLEFYGPTPERQS